MSNIFDSSKRRIARAKIHIHDLNGKVASFLKDNPCSHVIAIISDNGKNEIEKKKNEVEINARNRLQELLLDEVREIKSITLDADIGKFYDVDAPTSVLEKLRKADLLRD